MKNQDRSTKILLALLVAGIWGLLLRPFVAPSPVTAQTATTRAPQYAVAIDDFKGGVALKPLSAKTPSTGYSTQISGYRLEETIRLGASKGWRVKQLEPMGDGHFILFEK